MSEYSEILREGLSKAYAAASEARAKGFDPTDDVEVRVARDIAARVEGIVGPPGIADLIRGMETGGMAREDIAFEVARKIAAGEIFKANKELLIEQAVRTGLGILTEGVLVAPTEGIAKVKIKANPDGSDYVAVYYAGPIRSAGGTAAALSLVLADIARKVCGVGDYRATDSQMARYYEEITTYETRVTHLQYMPPEDDIKVIAGNCPICIDGEPTEDIEVSAYRGVPGVETDRVRGGVPLVMCEGVAAKAAKLLKYTKKLKLGWDWLEKIIKIKKKADKIEIKPDVTYMEGLVAGRPVFSHPSAKGGFRLRYGRSKTTCLMAKDVHPATMILLDGFLAYGTHMKIERPGKGCVISAHEGLEPPAVRLKNGRVMKVRTLEEAYAIKEEVEEILFLGDMLCTYGDFLKSNHPLIPSGYCEEWWEREIEAKNLPLPGAMDAASLFGFSRTHGVPLHPRFTYHWHDLAPEGLLSLARWLAKGRPESREGRIHGLILPGAEAKRQLEELIAEHRVIEGNVVLDGDDGYALLASLGMIRDDDLGKIDASAFEKAFEGFDASKSTPEGGGASKSALELVNMLSGIRIKAKAPTYIGARMGRPEKAKERKMDGSPHVLFPTGSFKNRSISKTYRTLKGREGEKTINLELSRMRCQKCKRLGYYRRCDQCGERAAEERICQKCGRITGYEMHCEMKTLSYDRRPVDIIELFEGVKERTASAPDEVKGVKGLSNALRIPERLEKGFLRAKHDVYVFRDGTSRFDATDVPLTHFTPREVGLPLERAKSLGYEKDYLGKPLESDLQTLALRHQDIILSTNGVEYFRRVADFIDDLLVNVYGMKSFYNIKNREDLLGHLCVGLSPHTSAGALCRIVGFTKANVGYAHPYLHTAKRRNCFHGDETLLVQDRNGFRLMKLRDFVETNLGSDFEKDDFGAEYKKINGAKTFAFNKATKKFELAEITHVSRHPAPKKLLRLRTKKGRRIIVTPDHPFPDRTGNKVRAEDATELLLPWNLENSEQSSAIKSIISRRPLKAKVIGNSFIDFIEDKKLIDNREPFVYSLTVAPHHNFICSGIVAFQCDGDEDCVMLLMDCLINFSRRFLDEKRGGTMDAPLVLSIDINPKEVDDEAHCIEFVSRYPLEFYEAAERMTPPGDIKLKTVKDVLGTPEQFELPITHPGGTMDVGNCRTAYVELQSIPEKIDIQFRLQGRLRPVDGRDAAERLILSHFIPDLYGNLRSFSRQTFRCVSCNTIFRRVPLAGKCARCGGNLLLTINKGGIEKYLQISRDIVERYSLPDYLKQRLELLEREIKSIFEDDKVKQMGLSDFL